MSKAKNEVEMIGTVRYVSYYSDDTGYCVLTLEPSDNTLFNSIKVVGEIVPRPFEDEEISLTGVWGHHAKYGEQFKISGVMRRGNLAGAGLVEYLSSKDFPGIGSALATAIIEYFGDDIELILTKAPERLAQVKGVSDKVAAGVGEAWADRADSRDSITFLCSLGVSARVANKIFKAYGKMTISTVKANPYALAWQVSGIGFMKADAIAMAHWDLALDDERRVQAGILHVLKEASKNGDLHLTEGALIKAAKGKKVLGLDHVELISRVLRDMTEHKEVKLTLVNNDFIKLVDAKDSLPLAHNRAYLIADDNREEGTVAYYLPKFWEAEAEVALRVERLMKYKPRGYGPDDEYPDWQKIDQVNTCIHIAMDEIDFALTVEQMDAVQMALLSQVSVITGGPGVGKTTILKALTVALNSMAVSYRLCSPTGRAAKRMKEATGRHAVTIHRLLEYQSRFTRHEQNLLKTDFVIVDEFSMVDMQLFQALLKAIPEGCKLLLVGDVDQLPSVGPGDVLRHLIDSDTIPVRRLTKILRQAEGSQIIRNAHLINNGTWPNMDNPDGTDFFYFGEFPTEDIADFIVDILVHRLEAKTGISPHNTQVLAPMYKGEAGVDILNSKLQAALNPPHPRKLEYRGKWKTFRQGDRVMQLRNDYDKGVYNGDVGNIMGIWPDGYTDQRSEEYGPCLTVDFDGAETVYEFGELNNLTLAYACTVHKSQGSEYDCIIMPVTKSHFYMLKRKLFYTAVTRGKKAVILVGQKQAVGMAVQSNPDAKRCSLLSQKLQNITQQIVEDVGIEDGIDDGRLFR